MFNIHYLSVLFLTLVNLQHKVWLEWHPTMGMESKLYLNVTITKKWKPAIFELLQNNFTWWSFKLFYSVSLQPGKILLCQSWRRVEAKCQVVQRYSSDCQKGVAEVPSYSFETVVVSTSWWRCRKSQRIAEVRRRPFVNRKCWLSELSSYSSKSCPDVSALNSWTKLWTNQLIDPLRLTKELPAASHLFARFPF